MVDVFGYGSFREYAKTRLDEARSPIPAMLISVPAIRPYSSLISMMTLLSLCHMRAVMASIISEE